MHRGIHWLSEQSTDLYEGAREKVQAFIGARGREEVIFTRGTTESINLVARSWGDANLQAGDEILLTEMEHHSNIVPWQQAAARTGAVRPLAADHRRRAAATSTRSIALLDAAHAAGGRGGRLERAGHDQPAGGDDRAGRTRPAPWCWSTRRKACRTSRPTWQALGADFLAFSGHKMLGPSGVGVLYGRRELLEAMPPFLGGGSMIRRVTTDGFEPAELPAKFEAGTPPIVPAIGLGAAIDYLNAVGLDAIRRARAAAHAAGSRGAGLDRRRCGFLGRRADEKAGIVSFTLERVHAHDVAQLLDRHGIAVRAGHHCAMPLHKRLGMTASTRASFYFYNTLDEVDRLGAALEEVKRIFRRK